MHFYNRRQCCIKVIIPRLNNTAIYCKRVNYILPNSYMGLIRILTYN